MQPLGALPAQSNALRSWNGNTNAAPAFDFLALLLNGVEANSEVVDLSDTGALANAATVSGRDSSRAAVSSDLDDQDSPKNKKKTDDGSAAALSMVDPRFLQQPFMQAPVQLRIPASFGTNVDDSSAEAVSSGSTDVSSTQSTMATATMGQTFPARESTVAADSTPLDLGQARTTPAVDGAFHSAVRTESARINPVLEGASDSRDHQSPLALSMDLQATDATSTANAQPSDPSQPAASVSAPDRSPVVEPAGTTAGLRTNRQVAAAVALEQKSVRRESMTTTGRTAPVESEAVLAATAAATASTGTNRSSRKASSEGVELIGQTSASASHRRGKSNGAETSQAMPTAAQPAASVATGESDSSGRDHRDHQSRDASPTGAASRKSRAQAEEASDQPVSEPAASRESISPPLHQRPAVEDSNGRLETTPRSSEASRAQPANEPPATETVKAAPLREISLKVRGDTDAGVDVHILEDKGKVHVEVRTADSHLATSLRENVGDLVGNLDKSGYRTESLKTHQDSPTVSATDGAQQASTNTGGRQSSAEQDPMAGQGGQSGQQHQQGHGRGNRPRWLDEIVRNFDPTVQEKENED